MTQVRSQYEDRLKGMVKAEVRQVRLEMIGHPVIFLGRFLINIFLNVFLKLCAVQQQLVNDSFGRLPMGRTSAISCQ